MNYVPGPWTIADKTLIVKVDNSAIWGARIVADCLSGHYPQKTCEANARLVAAAPELYEALNELLLMVQKITLGQAPPYEEQMRIREEAAQALLKAKGKTK